MLLIWCDLDVVGSNSRLHGIRVIQSLNVVEIRDVKGGDVVCGCESEISKFAVLGYIRAKVFQVSFCI